MPNHHIFGIRHHGPGSARSLRQALEALRPDLLLVEGPPDADGVLPLLAHADMEPPVALLVYTPDAPRNAVYYPFAVFSPEWQAIHYSLTNGIPVRFMDLPQWHQLGVEADNRPETEDRRPEPAERPGTEDRRPEPEIGSEDNDLQPSAFSLQPSESPHPSADPLGWLALAAGYSDGERWWERMVEQRRESSDLFAAILEAMSALRDEAGPPENMREARREAWMRQSIRSAIGAGFRRIAVVCGAWHGPALLNLANDKADAATLKGLPKVKTQATWAPWTYGRITSASGYGAGITSPGWYDHLWHNQEQIVERWMTRVARMLRDEGLDISAAHAIEAVRLAESLAALRDHPLPGLPELSEACQAVFCFGGDAPMQLIHNKLIVSERLGRVPDETPATPLQHDLQREQKRLRLAPEATWRDVDLDLRKPLDLERSHLLRRLSLLELPWGKLADTRSTGTFREIWRLAWQPEFSVSLIEASIWGSTVASAAHNRAMHSASAATDLPALVAVVNQALLADLPEAVADLVSQLQARAAETGDVGQLMDALVQQDQVTRTSLVGSLRYGNVRQTDAATLSHVVDGMVIRICIGLVGACAALNDEAAAAMFERIVAVNSALRLLNNADQLAAWHIALARVADMAGSHGLVAGRCCRILLDAGSFSAEELARRLGLALSTAEQPTHAAAWIEGMLRGSGTLLVHDEVLFSVLDSWLSGIAPESFLQIVPLLRRTFASFEMAERRALGERAKQVGAATTSNNGSITAALAFDQQRAEAVLPLVARLLGIMVNEERGTRNDEAA
ncbi:MAG: DUF5682 family protein [Chloroflexaceae bacterium]|jgi:hypothetical protein|nr:DUF5682 family protein [Chloroflexaceae bacterium]